MMSNLSPHARAIHERINDPPLMQDNLSYMAFMFNN